MGYDYRHYRHPSNFEFLCFDRAFVLSKQPQVYFLIFRQWQPRIWIFYGIFVPVPKDMDNTEFLGIIRKADRSFESISPGGFRAVNRDGFMVDLIKSEPKLFLSKETRRMGGPDDLEAAEIRNLQWLISSPKFSQVVIGGDGYPASLVVPDPRAFALHKLWLSEQADREPVKKQRDHDQGLTVAQLIIQYLPQYQFNTSS